LLLLLFA